MIKRKHTSISSRRSVSFAVVVGTGIAFAVSILLSTLLTSLILSGKLAENASTICIFAARTLGILVGGLSTAHIAGEKRLIVIGVTSGCYLLVLLALGIVFFDGAFENFGIGILSILLGGTAACLIAMKLVKTKKRSLRYVK